MSKPVNSFPSFDSAFGDKRLDARAKEAVRKMTMGRSSSIREVTDSRAEAKAFYRLLENEKFSEDKIEKAIVSRCGELCDGLHVLVIQDTSETNLTSHVGRLKKGDNGIGDTSQTGVKGYKLHPGMVIDADSGTALGYSSVKIWHREEGAADADESYRKKKIEDKESYKWIECIESSLEHLGKAKMITVIADRESDMYDMFGRYAAHEKVKLVLRSSSDRSINTEEKTLIKHLATVPVSHTYQLNIRGDIRKGIVSQVVDMELKWTTVELKKPHSCNDESLPASVSVNVVEAKQKDKKGGLNWRILTTHEINKAEEALQIIDWYKERWYIEQVFRLLKTEGFKIERSQLESGYAIRKLNMIALLAILRIMQMMLAYEDENAPPIGEVFSEEEQVCLKQCNATFEGQTDKLKNLNDPSTLKWATWIIARLGGWDGYQSQRKPGPIVLHRGYIKFYNLFEGWAMSQRFFKDVGTP